MQMQACLYQAQGQANLIKHAFCQALRFVTMYLTQDLMNIFFGCVNLNNNYAIIRHFKDFLLYLIEHQYLFFLALLQHYSNLLQQFLALLHIAHFMLILNMTIGAF